MKEAINKLPNQDILNAFGIEGVPVHLAGGEGTCYRVDNVVLKPTQHSVEATWVVEINNRLASDKFRVPKPIPAKDGSWVVDGWTAAEFLPGEHRPGHYAEAIQLSRVFHGALAGIPKPGWFDQKTDIFSVSDKMAWGELPLPDFDLTNEPFKRIFGRLQENRLPNQLIHGDWGMDQILFHASLPPGVIDLTPYFRPADYPIADMMVGAMAYDGADASILDLGKNIEDFDQLLLRAVVMRTCTYIGFQLHPENDQDRTPHMMKHLNLVNVILKI